jgi:hypothetical protein
VFLPLGDRLRGQQHMLPSFGGAQMLLGTSGAMKGSHLPSALVGTSLLQGSTAERNADVDDEKRKTGESVNSQIVILTPIPKPTICTSQHHERPLHT